MRIETDLRQRLQFIARVAAKECAYLQRTSARLFAQPFSLEIAQQLEQNDALAEQVEAFAARFGRCQDILGDKFIPHLLTALGEPRRAFIDNLDKAERLGWIASVDEWQAMRRLRNQMVHEYIENREIFTAAIVSAWHFVPVLQAVNQRLQQELWERGWQEKEKV
jgi:hypothetical protein